MDFIYSDAHNTIIWKIRLIGKSKIGNTVARHLQLSAYLCEFPTYRAFVRCSVKSHNFMLLFLSLVKFGLIDFIDTESRFRAYAAVSA